MTTQNRCEEILRLIDSVLGVADEAPALVPITVERRDARSRSGTSPRQR